MKTRILKQSCLGERVICAAQARLLSKGRHAGEQTERSLCKVRPCRTHDVHSCLLKPLLRTDKASLSIASCLLSSVPRGLFNGLARLLKDAPSKALIREEFVEISKNRVANLPAFCFLMQVGVLAAGIFNQKLYLLFLRCGCSKDFWGTRLLRTIQSFVGSGSYAIAVDFF